ncbi:MarR family winged helix-turn-helix transcriptional regulator [Companilactobacillus furfuricola]|uniref:MarR family winged helix-turn-helix transcriptional regulator n=1 Tax=Companilactobacillus furfuricola TaxID=1462575 RepID=UPI000F7747D6|nr:MarR family transcriptional regulator [Companilactobacillus furfuricola]
MDYTILTGFSVRYLMTKKRTLNSILKEQDLNPVDGVLMVFIGNHPGFSQEKIGEVTLFDGASIARSLKRLEQAEFATRKVHPTNHRKKLVQLTPKGEEFLALIKKADKEVTDKLFDNISATDQKKLDNILHRVFDNFDELNIQNK